jgi:dTDP-4-amino-4,6-dideoxygalactose transaminase
MGDIGCFSFQSSKLMTSGEGGIVITSRLDCFEAIQSLVNCGRASVTDRYKRRLIGSNCRITEFQAAILLGQLEQLPALAAKRLRHAGLLTDRLSEIPGIRSLPPQPAMTKTPIYNYVFQYRGTRVPRDIFAAALDREGIPCDGRFYEAVYRSDLFQASPADFPQLKRWYGPFHCPVAERAAYEESMWLPQFLLLGDEQDVDDIAHAVEKVVANLDSLAEAGTNLAGIKSMSRAERPGVEKEKNY